MTGKQIDTVLEKLNLVLEDLQMLRDGTLIPDTKSCEVNIDNISYVIDTIEND